jgi:tetratricopeptide (TPR) repeat protein
MSKKKTRKEKIAEQKLQGIGNKKLKKKSVEASPQKTKSKLLPTLAIIGVLIFTGIIFSSALDNGFVNWDDDKNFYENSNITSLTDGNFWANTKQIFTDPVIGNYNPLSTWTFLVENKAFGLDQPFYWHLDNLILHLLCVLMVFLLCLQLKLGTGGAIMVALLFGIHPMRVESVAWVTERKDVLYGVFYLTALFFYAKSINKNKSYLIPILLCFILSLFSKVQAVVLPMSMIAIDYLLKQKITWKDVYSKWFYFALSLGAGILAIFVLKDQGSLESNASYPIWQRLFIGSYSYIVYLVKAVVPYRMSPLYPYPTTFPVWFYPTILIAPVLVGGLWYGFKKKFKAVVFGLLFFTFNIFFLLQILGAGQGFLADRFTYMAYFGLFFIMGYYYDKLIQSKKFKIPAYAVYGAGVLGFAFMSFNQNKIWKNSGTLWTHVLKYYTNTTLPYGNRANYYRDAGQIDLALADYSARIRLKPNEAAPYNSRGRLYFNSTNQQDWFKALADYNKAIEIQKSTEQASKSSNTKYEKWKKNTGEYHSNRGAINAKMNKLEAAIQDFNMGIQLNPNHAVGYLNRSIMNNMRGDIPAALADIEAYLKINPYNADLWYEAGICKRKLRREADALPDFNKAIQYNNSKGIYYHERCKTLLTLGRKQEARNDYNRAIQLGFSADPSILPLLN